ncbi:hypothetical protein DTL42_17205 [Bremerella cremea]|uniref:Uncharacterized protein n=1 Tax=Bremerella cremea TaxID=1031537 RepID=A0A368KQF2_9BACT|nr:hypothetical protein DTL42_17205 [Bremerella cremea]
MLLANEVRRDAPGKAWEELLEWVRENQDEAKTRADEYVKYVNTLVTQENQNWDIEAEWRVGQDKNGNDIQEFWTIVKSLKKEQAPLSPAEWEISVGYQPFELTSPPPESSP